MRKKKRVVKNTRTTTKEYLLSEHWKTLTKSLAKQDETCEICSTPHWHKKKNGTWKYVRVFVWHHVRYTHLYEEPREDLQRLCKRCHDECHRILRMKDDCEMVHELKEAVRKYFFYEPTERKKK